MLPLVVCLALSGNSAGADPAGHARLQELLEIMPTVPAWDTWLKESGELPPDFAQMPSIADLPDPLVAVDGEKGSRVTTGEAWAKQRVSLQKLFAHWILGTVPPPPDNLEAQVLSETPEAGATVREVELRFGQNHAGKLWLQLYIPPGAGPFPVFMTQDNHRAWALIALRRGYLACVYAGADSRDDTDSFPAAYPGYDWSRLTRRAWAASRCIDYLTFVPEANVEQIALTGHSRNGKLSLIASALDERIAVVISSSSGTGGCMPSRYCGEPHFAEGIENITRAFPEWFHPRWRFFVGREQKMPVDLHELVALSAPRACLLSIALNDDVESSWAMEKSYLAVKPVYTLLGAEDRLRILWRPGGHETWPTTIERYMDWCDLQFGRGDYVFPERLIHPWDWEGWRRNARQAPDPAAFPERPFERGIAATDVEWGKRRTELRDAVKNMLGAAPPAATAPTGTYGEEPDHIERLLDRDDPGRRLEKNDLVFGEYINGDIYVPQGLTASGEKAPAVLWLHPFSFSQGYVAGYRRGEQAFRTFAREGFAVFCYDQVGCGRRIEEVEGFYARYPDWSLLGKMVRDAQAAIDAMVSLPYVDSQKIYVVGYGLGAMVALHLAAVEERPAGYALVCAPPPFRLDTDLAETGGIRRWSHLYMLLPQLGVFVGQENRIPYDLDELLAMMSPRPVLLSSPRLDREAPLPLMEHTAASARAVYVLDEAEKALTHEIPEAYNHFDPAMQSVVVKWLQQLTASGK